ncbi:MAG: alpha/beta hydrolase [Lachnoclostridium sp.]|nr:alpha/beta hydrolase [Lachnoclostridium sp.]
MNKLIISLVSLFMAFSLSASTVNMDVDGNQLIVFLTQTPAADGKAVLILPGGGYSHLAMEHEGTQIAQWLADNGITAGVLAYPMPKGEYAKPADTVRKAMKLMRSHASEWGFSADSLGIVGSSAGGHLASTVATHGDKADRPAFQVLLYPVITMDSTLTHPGSRKNLLGKNPSAELEALYSNELQVDSLTPRAFVVLSNDDTVVPPLNSINYYEALIDNSIPASLHIYPTGGHGWGMRTSFRYHNLFTDELLAWLRSF